MRVFEKDGLCVTRRIGAEIIIVPVKASVADLRAVYTLNESAAEIWHRIDGRTTEQQLVDEICSMYEVPVPEAERDVGEALDTLSSAGLIRLAAKRERHPL